MVIQKTSTSASSTARIVWDTADKYLRNVVEPQEYGDYILPFTVLRRLECLLEDTKDDVIEFVNAQGDMPSYLIDIAVSNRFGLSFFNTSPLNLARIASVDDNVDRALLSYVNAFSHNIADIWTAFEFPKLVAKLSAANRLLEVVKHFSTLSLGSTSVEDSTMGDIFEDVMYRAFDKKGKAAGAFYTPRDAIKLMVDVLFAADVESLAGEDVLRSIYDPTAGSGGMLLVAQEALRELNPGVKVTVYGQEMMDSAYALGKADLLIQGGRPDAILKGDTLLEDLHADKTFDYVLSNPPFGGDWEVEYASVREQAQVPGSRFSHGLPSKSDGQMLFLCHCASKLSPSGGRAAVVSNASPLFNSDTGPNSIRQWLFDEDLIDAIIALPTQMFYGTGIATYVWILDNDKPLKRRGKIQLLDASGLWEPMRKGMGDKRREMSEANREAVVHAYQRFEDSEISRILTPQDFMFRDVPVFKQARLAARFSDEAVEVLRSRRDFSEALVRVLRGLDGVEWNGLPERIRSAAKAEGIKAPVGLIDAVMKAMAVPDDDAPLAVDRKGAPVLADGWRIVERVPVTEDLDEHMATEVLPFAPGATWDESNAKEGNEIPFTRIFYVPEEPRPLAEIDADVQRIMDELAQMFQEVSRG
ncbi:MAG: class I SAM-dependent DNA methyltransferase [Actinomyces sp.]|uniref:type I restriction-modification system subunit M n=1 Tax=Actinomyces sp. TaxID=29317 RepID=UPI0025F266AF|nr:class I SAM-dependent DNA methyltransferase [Actinomyces sp.]MDU1430273.1 class I SAM-dependent DNA methyltransferase [Actinomyces sp.]